MTEKGREAGFSLIEIMIAASIFIILSLAISGFLASTFRSARSADMLVGLQQVRAALNGSVSCAVSVDPGLQTNIRSACAGGGMVRLYSSSRKVVVSDDDKNPTRAEVWTLKAHCSPEGIEVLAATPKKSIKNPLSTTSTSPADFHLEPMLKKAFTWKDPKVVTPMKLCQSEVSSLLKPADPTGTILSPLGKCRVVQEVRTKLGKGASPGNVDPDDGNAPLTSGPKKNSAGFSVINIKCPRAYPTAMSVSINPACFASNWTAFPDISPGGAPRGGTCLLSLAEDTAAGNPQKLNAMKSTCQAQQAADPSSFGINEFACQVICCQL